MIFAVPIPEDKAADSQIIKAAINQALAEADAQKILGAEITPFLLKRVNELSGGESSESSKYYKSNLKLTPFLDVALIKNNAKLGAQISVKLS
jgi:pseudouridine-5'-phosphate glycosidase